MPFGWFRRGRSRDSSRFGHYQIIRLIHEGHKATVYQVRNLPSDELCALKLYSRLFDQEMRRLRKRYNLPSEGEIGRRLNPRPDEDPAQHSIVRTLDEGHEFGRKSAPYFVVQEFVDGFNLKNLITVSPEQLNGQRLWLAQELARGLDIIHRSGYVHRDFGSDNVLLTRPASAGHAKIIDLGFVAPSGMKFRERTGTPSYMAPEQIRGETLTPATDVYAAGVILYEVFTGRLPFGSGARKASVEAAGRRPSEEALLAASGRVLSQHLDTPPKPLREIAAEIPEAIEQFVLQCLEKSPGKRFADGRSLLAELGRLAALCPSL